jgi:hypothetical protein
MKGKNKPKAPQSNNPVDICREVLRQHGYSMIDGSVSVKGGSATAKYELKSADGTGPTMEKVVIVHLATRKAVGWTG